MKVLLFSARSRTGSTWVEETLGTANNVKVHGELLAPKDPAEFQPLADYRDTVRIIDQSYQEGMINLYRVFFYHTPDVLQILRNTFQHKILIVRENALAQWSSDQMGQKTGVWQTPTDPDECIRFNERQFLVQYYQLKNTNALLMSRAGFNEVFYYHSLFEQTMNLADRLGIQVDPTQTKRMVTRCNDPHVLNRFYGEDRPAVLKTLSKINRLEWVDDHTDIPPV